MTKICNQTDIDKSKLGFVVRKIIANHLEEIFSANDISDLAELGAVYYTSELSAVKKLIDLNSIEWSTQISVDDKNVKSMFYLCCYVVNNDVAIDVLMPRSVLDDESLRLVEEAVNRRDYYYFC